MSTPLFRIGSTDFAFAPESSASFKDGGMSFELRAQPVRFDAAAGHERIFPAEGSDTAEAGWIAPGLWSSTFFFDDLHGAPRQRFEHPGPAGHDCGFYLWEKGMRFGVCFFGQVDLRPDRIELQGVLRAAHESDEQGLPVHVLWPCAPGEFALKPHLYRSLKAASHVPPQHVRELLLSEWDGQWPETLRAFERLEFLSLQQHWAKPGEPVAAVPDWLGDLRALRRLYLRSPNIQALPDTLGQLQALEELSVTYGQLQALPESIGQLSQLRQLTLSGNRLRTLPERIGDLLALTHLNIEGNPFESLPASLKKIRKVNVEKKSEALFRDIRYRPEIEVAIDRDIFMARSSPAHAELLSAALARHKLKRYEKALLRHARQALRLVSTEPDDGTARGRTRVGGAPDLPPGIEYPATDGRLWHFYAQLDLQALAPLQGWLPRSGHLYFFGEGQEHGDGVRVLHLDAPADALRPYAWPEGAEFVDGSDVADAYTGFEVRVDATVSVPSLYSARERLGGKDAVLLRIEDDEKLQKAYWALEEELTGNADRQRGAHTMNAEVFTQHENPQEQASRERGGLPEEWINLLMLDSDSNPGFCFWDAGTLTFSIHEKDLALGDFSRVHWSLESS
ncbi:DUF1963 domain-containing protein [Xenophilus arseniciresistens]|uniref:DUF1963 domain-containing protein n=1 Tax=Xenophilus arseniciresistens TaxID=1283306 RepID=A0AAE3SYB2_9BURK|nr:DUF1963 domain-containing protein [Xenophilus arseniciresistens]MDA7415849.1 DUF1963 domain-containing protein [Xenophilus arseniciresistens]